MGFEVGALLLDKKKTRFTFHVCVSQRKGASHKTNTSSDPASGFGVQRTGEGRGGMETRCSKKSSGNIFNVWANGGWVSGRGGEKPETDTKRLENRTSYSKKNSHSTARGQPGRAPDTKKGSPMAPKPAPSFHQRDENEAHVETSRDSEAQSKLPGGATTEGEKKKELNSGTLFIRMWRFGEWKTCRKNVVKAFATRTRTVINGVGHLTSNLAWHDPSIVARQFERLKPKGGWDVKVPMTRLWKGQGQ